MRITPSRACGLLFFCAVFLSLGLAAAGREPSFDLKAHYDKTEYRIPMRDGVRLFVAVYTPKDKLQRYPMLMRRTPYSIESYGLQKFHHWQALAPSEPSCATARSSCCRMCAAATSRKGNGKTSGLCA